MNPEDAEMDPWKLLGLDSKTADERAVKSAYARLVREHRPDRDPEGFQALQRAREMAMRELRWQAYQSTFSDDLDTDEAGDPDEEVEVRRVEDTADDDENWQVYSSNEAEADPAEEEMAPGFNEAFAPRVAGDAQLREALDKRDPVGLSRRMRELWEMGPAKWAETVGAEWGDAASEGAMLCPLITTSQLVAAVAAGDTLLACHWLTYNQEKGNYEVLGSFGQALLMEGVEPDVNVAMSVYASLAHAVAFSHPSLARQLSDKAFTAAPKVLRWKLDELESWIALGRIFADLPEDCRLQWQEYLLQAQRGEITSWNVGELRTLVRETRNHVEASEWPGFRILGSVIPKNVWWEATNNLNVGPNAEALPPPPQRSYYETSTADFPWGRLVFLLPVLIMMVANAGQCSSSSYRTPGYSDSIIRQVPSNTFSFPSGSSSEEIREILEQHKALKERLELGDGTLLPSSDTGNFAMDQIYESVQKTGVQNFAGLLQRVGDPGIPYLKYRILHRYVNDPENSMEEARLVPEIAKQMSLTSIQCEKLETSFLAREDVLKERDEKAAMAIERFLKGEPEKINVGGNAATSE